jgi:hypothetical protein
VWRQQTIGKMIIRNHDIIHSSIGESVTIRGAESTEASTEARALAPQVKARGLMPIEFLPNALRPQVQAHGPR